MAVRVSDCQEECLRLRAVLGREGASVRKLRVRYSYEWLLGLVGGQALSFVVWYVWGGIAVSRVWGLV